MSIIRNNEGFLLIDEVVNESQKIKEYPEFDYENNHYYFKEPYDEIELYNELIAEEFAKDMNIPCCTYDLAILNNRKGTISKSEKDKYDTFETLSSYFKAYNMHNPYKSLEDVWDILYYEYRDNKVVESLMNQIVKIYIFDILIGNIDRSSNNLAIVSKDGNVSIYPIFDNAMMASKLAIDSGEYVLSVDANEPQKALKRFLEISSSSYCDMISKYLNIISDKNIEDVFKRVELKINSTIPSKVKIYIYNNLKTNMKNIEEVVDKEIKRKESNR